MPAASDSFGFAKLPKGVLDDDVAVNGKPDGEADVEEPNRLVEPAAALKGLGAAAVLEASVLGVGVGDLLPKVNPTGFPILPEVFLAAPKANGELFGAPNSDDCAGAVLVPKRLDGAADVDVDGLISGGEVFVVLPLDDPNTEAAGV